MPRNLVRDPFGAIVRAQLALFRRLGDLAMLSEDDRRDALELDERTWMAWMGFLAEGPLPYDPPLPEMLRRLSESAFNLSILAEQRGATV